MQVGQVRDLRRGPTGPSRRVLSFTQDGDQSQASKKGEQSLMKILEKADTDRASGRLRKEKSMSLVSAWVSGVFY